MFRTNSDRFSQISEYTMFLQTCDFDYKSEDLKQKNRIVPDVLRLQYNNVEVLVQNEKNYKGHFGIVLDVDTVAWEAIVYITTTQTAVHVKIPMVYLVDM